jgi:hypothetical protein
MKIDKQLSYQRSFRQILIPAALGYFWVATVDPANRTLKRLPAIPLK